MNVLWFSKYFSMSSRFNSHIIWFYKSINKCYIWLSLWNSLDKLPWTSSISDKHTKLRIISKSVLGSATNSRSSVWGCTVYPKKYAHGFVVLCFVMVMQSFIMNSHEVFIHIHQVCFAGTGAMVRLPQCQWSKPDGYGENSQCITTTKHNKAKTVCIFLGIYCRWTMCLLYDGPLIGSCL